MMWGDGMNMGWLWLWGLILIIGIVLLVLAGVRLFTGGGSHGSPQGQAGPYPGRSRACLILDERFARGELSAEQYREQLKVLRGDQ